MDLEEAWVKATDADAVIAERDDLQRKCTEAFDEAVRAEGRIVALQAEVTALREALLQLPSKLGKAEPFDVCGPDGTRGKHAGACGAVCHVKWLQREVEAMRGSHV